jgi:hypothetical protein
LLELPANEAEVAPVDGSVPAWVEVTQGEKPAEPGPAAASTDAEVQVDVAVPQALPAGTTAAEPGDSTAAEPAASPETAPEDMPLPSELADIVPEPSAGQD